MDNKNLTRKEFLRIIGRYAILAVLAFISGKSIISRKAKGACPITGMAALPGNCLDCNSQIRCSKESGKIK